MGARFHLFDADVSASKVRLQALPVLENAQLQRSRVDRAITPLDLVQEELRVVLDFMYSDQVLIELVACISSNHVSNKLQKSRVLALVKCKKAELRITLLFSIRTLLFSFC